ncbi:MAG: ribbon-helix-helix domain-containing protein [Methanotrichaceae archaeon]|nr:ribbon-helix-helix domain-containing protein [Methanotrichaceae archaeon]
MSASNKETIQSVSVSIGTKIAPAEARQIRELIEAGVYLNESDFVRDAIRHTGYPRLRSSNAGMSTTRQRKKRSLAITRAKQKPTQTRLRGILRLILIS